MMSESIKEKIINKAIDEVLEVVADISKEELGELLEKNKLQKIMEKTIVKFADSSYFKKEYKNVTFVYIEGAIYNLTDEEINVAKSIEQIAEAVKKIISSYFIYDESNVENELAQKIAVLYLQRAKTTVKLYDIIRIQQESFSNITEDISELRKVIVSNYRDEVMLRRERELLLKKTRTDILITKVWVNGCKKIRIL